MRQNISAAELELLKHILRGKSAAWIAVETEIRRDEVLERFRDIIEKLMSKKRGEN